MQRGTNCRELFVDRNVWDDTIFAPDVKIIPANQKFDDFQILANSLRFKSD